MFINSAPSLGKNSSPVTLNGDPSTLDEYRRFLEPYTPEYVEKLSGVPA